MTFNQALDKLFLLKPTEEIAELIREMQEKKLIFGGRTKVGDSLKEKIENLTEKGE